MPKNHMKAFLNLEGRERRPMKKGNMGKAGKGEMEGVVPESRSFGK